MRFWTTLAAATAFVRAQEDVALPTLGPSSSSTLTGGSFSPGKAGTHLKCTTSRCFNVTGEISSHANLFVDPCTNPYLHACGTWQSQFQLPPDEGSWTLSFNSISKANRDALRLLLEAKRCPPPLPRTAIDPPSTDALRDAMLSCFYATCMDTKRADRLGGWPLHQLLAKTTPWLLEHARLPNATAEAGKELDANLRRRLLSERLGDVTYKLHVPTILYLHTEPNALDAQGTHVLYLYESGLGLQYRQYEHAEVIRLYQDYLKTLLSLATREIAGDAAEARLTDIPTRVDAVIQLERDIRGMSLSPEMSRDVIATTNPMTWKAVTDMLAPGLNLTLATRPLFALGTSSDDDPTPVPPTNPSFSALRADGHHPFEYAETETVILDHPIFFTHLARHLETVWPWETVHDYFLLHTLRSYAPYLSRAYREAAERFNANVTGAEPPPRWKKCQNETANLGWILARRYVDSLPDPYATKYLVESMVISLKHAYATLMDDVSWMDATTKEHARRKLESVGYKIGFPDWLVSNPESKYKEYYGPPNPHAVDAMRDRVGARLYLAMRAAKYSLRKLRTPKDFTEWHMYPQEVNAYFTAVTNEIVFPLSILRQPFLYEWNATQSNATILNDSGDGNQDDLIYEIASFGGLGSVIGHELTHGFDDQGRHFNEKGQLQSWWSEESQRAFDRAAACVADQYSEYKVALLRPDTTDPSRFTRQLVPLSGNLTLGENIADNGGFDIAFTALRARHPGLFPQEAEREIGPRLTPQQMYTLTFAQTWCTAYREKSLLRRINSDPHSPGYFRVIGTFTNSRVFSDAYQCPAGTPLHPKMVESFPSSDSAVAGRDEDPSPSILATATGGVTPREGGGGTRTGRLPDIDFNVFTGLDVPERTARCRVW